MVIQKKFQYHLLTLFSSTKVWEFIGMSRNYALLVFEISAKQFIYLVNHNIISEKTFARFQS